MQATIDNRRALAELINSAMSSPLRCHLAVILHSLRFSPRRDWLTIDERDSFRKIDEQIVAFADDLCLPAPESIESMEVAIKKMDPKVSHGFLGLIVELLVTSKRATLRASCSSVPKKTVCKFYHEAEGELANGEHWIYFDYRSQSPDVGEKFFLLERDWNGRRTGDSLLCQAVEVKDSEDAAGWESLTATKGLDPLVAIVFRQVHTG